MRLELQTRAIEVGQGCKLRKLDYILVRLYSYHGIDMLHGDSRRDRPTEKAYLISEFSRELRHPIAADSETVWKTYEIDATAADEARTRFRINRERLMTPNCTSRNDGASEYRATL
jgi:hypothetical protein